MHPKQAHPDHPIHELIANRWSPYAFSAKPVPAEDLRSVFEAARWAASSFNEQPWRYIAATAEDAAEHAKIVDCLAGPNQSWASSAPVLALSLAKLTFARNGKPNRCALHDLGAASATLTLEAASRGLFVHQMAGIDPAKARETFAVPADFEIVAALAIGYRADDHPVEEVRKRDARPRSRKPLGEILFSGGWEQPAEF